VNVITSIFVSLFLLTATVSCSSSSSTSSTQVQESPIPTDAPLSSDAELILNWIESNQASVNEFGSAVELFESEVMSPNKLDNRGMARASIVLYNALSNLPMQPANVPLSSEFNRAINQMVIVMGSVSSYAASGDYDNMLIAALEWQAARDVYDSWFASLPRD
jgi:hypothetical protein